MPHISASHAPAAAGASSPRRSKRSVQGNGRKDRSASRQDTSSGSSPEQTLLDPAPQPTSRPTSVGPKPERSASDAEQVIKVQQDPKGSLGGEPSQKVKPLDPVAEAEPPQTPPQRQPTDCRRLIPFIVVISVFLALGGQYLYGPPKPDVQLEHDVPFLTRHAQSSASLLEYVQELQTPLLDHLSVRVMRSAAGYANLDTLRSDLNVFSTQITDAKHSVMELGVSIWMAGSTTHSELTHVLSSLTSSPVEITAADIQETTEYTAGKLVDLHAAAATSHALLVSAHTLGTTISQSTDWRTLEQKAGSTQRMKWLGKGADGDSGLRAGARETVAAVERCGSLVNLLEKVQGDVEVMLANLREIGAENNTSGRSRESNRLNKLTDELRDALDGLAVDVKRTQPNQS